MLLVVFKPGSAVELANTAYTDIKWLRHSVAKSLVFCLAKECVVGYDCNLSETGTNTTTPDPHYSLLNAPLFQ